MCGWNWWVASKARSRHLPRRSENGLNGRESCKMLFEGLRRRREARRSRTWTVRMMSNPQKLQTKKRQRELQATNRSARQAKRYPAGSHENRQRPQKYTQQRRSITPSPNHPLRLHHHTSTNPTTTHCCKSRPAPHPQSKPHLTPRHRNARTKCARLCSGLRTGWRPARRREYKRWRCGILGRVAGGWLCVVWFGWWVEVDWK